MLRRLKWWIDRRQWRKAKAAAGRAPEPASSRPALDILVDMLVKFEGFRSTAYQCSGNVWTYGYGSTYLPNGKRVQEHDHITEPEARALLTETAVHCLARARELTDGYAPTQGCLAAIASLIYNVGSEAVAKSRFLAAWKRIDMDTAKREFIDFNKANGVVVDGLTNRRIKEWAVLTGKAKS